MSGNGEERMRVAINQDTPKVAVFDVEGRGPLLNYIEGDLPKTMRLLSAGVGILADLVERALKERPARFLAWHRAVVQVLQELNQVEGRRDTRVGALLQEGQELLDESMMAPEPSRIFQGGAICHRCRRPVQSCLCANPLGQK